MIAVNLLVALIVIWLPSWLILSRLVPSGSPGHSSIVAGYSLLLGLLTVPILMRLLSYAGVSFSVVSIGIASGLVLLCALALPKASATRVPESFANSKDYAGWQKLLIAVCLALIALRLITLGLELSLRPVFSWDAKQHWAKQAKVFYEAGSVVPFVPLQEWLERGGEGIFANIHPDYPITIPLLQVWTNVALGEWNDSLMNLPWVLCYLSIGLIFYGQLRVQAMGSGLALAATYMLLSIPMLDSHVALAGYADIFMAACYLASIAAFYAWSLHRERWQGLLALGFALGGLLIKQEGFYWLLTFIPGLMFVLMPFKRALMALVLLALTALLLFWVIPADFVISGHSMNSLNLGFRPESLNPIMRSFLMYDNWHLLSYLFIGLIVATLLFAKKTIPQFAPLLATIFSAISLYLVLYLFTRHAYGAVNYTSLNRVALQFIPALGFVTAVLYAQLLNKAGRPQAQ